ncbi:MAG: phosphoribosylpyrophosphate synthetase [Nitrospiraceae bacterium]
MTMKGYKTMTEAVEDLKKRGFTANFELLGKTFRAVDKGKEFQPSDLTIVEHHRFEGASDPDDMAVLYAIEAKDGTRGVIVDAFGPQANPDLGAFLKNVKMREDL